MVDLITDHAYERGPYGRCAAGSPPCNKRKSSHDNEPVPGPVVSPLRLESSSPPQTTNIEAPVAETFPPPTSFPTDETEVHAGGWEAVQATHFPGTLDVQPPTWEFSPAPCQSSFTIRLVRRGEEGVEAAWPQGWPLPLVGQVVALAGGYAPRRVEHITFDLDLQRIILYCE